MRVLVTGGRTWGVVPDGTPPHRRQEAKAQASIERNILGHALDALCIKAGDMLPLDPSLVIIHGDARGADTIAADWAVVNWVQTEVYPVTPEEWRAFGHGAGPRRNERMLRLGRPDVVVAAPGGSGTADMIGKALSAGIRIIHAA